MIRFYAILVLIIVGAYYGIRYLQRILSTFHITVSAKDFVIRGEVPTRLAPGLKPFLNELHLPTGAVIRGVGSTGDLRLEMSRNIPAETQQRIRNYFFSY